MSQIRMYLHHFCRSKIWKLSSNDLKQTFIIVRASFRNQKSWRMGFVSSTSSTCKNQTWWVGVFTFSLQMNFSGSVITKTTCCARSGGDWNSTKRFAARVHETARVSREEYGSFKKEVGEESGNPPRCLHAHYAGNKPFPCDMEREKGSSCTEDTLEALPVWFLRTLKQFWFPSHQKFLSFSSASIQW